ncbi:MAG: hypothetical protein IJO32_07255 [Bacilli bacterium]|nr:hypothetical protein [Bacilli bacterium]
MKLITLDSNKYNDEINRFNECITLLQKIFSKSYASKFTSELDDKIDTIISFNDRALIGGGYYGDSNIVNGKFVVRYGTSKDVNANRFIALHELLHVIITPINKGEIVVKDNCSSSQGITKYDNIENKFYGIALTETFCNIIAKIAILNKNHESIDNYLVTGLPDYIYNYYSPFEDISRLLFFASCNDYLVKYDIEQLINNEGIDAIIGEPINKPYSTFINSVIKNDFEMEIEFDSFVGKNEFKNMCLELDSEMLKIKINDSIEEPKYNLKVFESVIIKIETYYFNKLEYLHQRGIIGINEKEKLLNEFDSILNSIKLKIKN